MPPLTPPDHWFSPTAPSSTDTYFSTTTTDLSVIQTDRESLCSASYSDRTYGCSSEETMDPPLPPIQEDVSVVMTQVLYRMDRIVEHLRGKGKQLAANNIAKNMISIVNIFNNTTVEWDIENSLIPAPVDLLQHALSGTDNSQLKKSDLPPRSNNPCTWAAVAAVVPANTNNLVKYPPRDIVQSRYVENQTPLATADSEQRVVWIRGWKEGRPLSDITKSVGQGPIYSIAYSPKDDSVCIIFQYASSAKALCEDDEEALKVSKKGKFGDGCSVAMGLAFPSNDDINRMGIPHNERRRLTFARAQLFAQGMTEAKFRSDIYSIVGPANVELVWLFNTGNATVVFSAVPLARMVRDEFMKKGRQFNSPYRDVHVTFSHDPCERPMSLIKQMPAGRDLREGTYGGHSALPAGISTNDTLVNRRNVRDSDGWQTVSRKG